MSTVLPRIGRQFSWIVLGRLVGALIQAVSMALLARWIGPSEFGLFASAYGTAIIVQTVVDFGLATYVVRVRALEPTSEYLRVALELVTRINTGTAVVGLIGAGLMTWYDEQYLALMPFAIWVALDRQVETWLAIPLADGDTRQNAASLVARRGLSLIILLAGAAAGIDPLLAYTSGLAISSALWCFVVMERNRSPFRRPKVSARTVLSAARPFWANSVATQARNLDALLVSILVGPLEAGYYGAASRLTTPLRLVPTSFAQVLMPAATRAKGSDRRGLIRGAARMVLATSTLYALVAAVVPFAVPHILGEQFAPATPVIQIVCIGLVFAAIASQLNALLQGWGQLRSVAAISTVTTVACLIGIATLTPVWRGIGAAAALSASYGVQVALLISLIIVGERRKVRADRIHEYRSS